MMKKRKITITANQGLVLIALALILLNLCFLYFYINNNYYFTKSKVSPNKNHQFFHTIMSLADTLKPKTLKNAINIIEQSKSVSQHYTFKLSITDKPKETLQFSQDTETQTILDKANTHDGSIQLSYQLKNGKWLNYTELTRRYSSLLFSSIVIVLEFLIIGFAAFYFLSLRRFTHPLRKFKESAERLGMDVNATTSTLHGPNLVQETADALRTMQQRIQELVKNRTRMLAAISHDLKTPLTRIKLRIRMLPDSEESRATIRDLDEMNEMIQGVLSFARKDMLNEKKVKFDLAGLLETIYHDAEDMGQNVTFHSSNSIIPFFGRQLAMKRAFTNLINNAVKYAGNANIQIEDQKSRVIITIDDNGPGIPDKEIPEIFKAFYRAKDARSDNSTGSGLGLTIASEVIQAHKGSLTVRNKQSHHGLVVKVVLPL